MNNQPQSIQIRASDQDIKGVYSNMMQVIHTQEEFMIDFFNIVPNQQTGTLVSRVILSPGHLKRSLAALSTNLANYEKQFGNIAPAAAPEGEIGFRG